MADWKFTDQYGANYPALENSILAILVFDVPDGTSPVQPDGKFSAPLDLTATGQYMNVLASMTGMSSIAMSGTVSTDDDKLTVALSADDKAALLAAFSSCIPLIGQVMESADVTIDNETPATATLEDGPTVDKLAMQTGLTISGRTATLTMQVPMTSGSCTIRADFENFGISLSDLNFLVTGTTFSTQFPTTLPSSYYNSSTQLSLLSLGLDLTVKISPSLSIGVSSVSVSIGIVNIPLLPNALFLNPLSVWIIVTDPTTNPSPEWGLSGLIALYPYGNQTNPPSADPDFTFDLEMQFPGSDPTFYVSGQYTNSYNLPVSQMICDLLDDPTFNTGIASDITLTQFDFYTAADTTTGTISEFTTEIGMSSPFGIFQTSGIDVKDFTISVSYTS